jgi:hypothetical protein
MSAVRFFTDEDVYADVAPALRRAGIDAVSTREAERLAETDEVQLQWSATAGRVIVSFNVGHFAELHWRWLSEGRHHAGIVVSQQRPIGDTIRRLRRLADELDAEAMHDRFEYLSDW